MDSAPQIIADVGAQASTLLSAAELTSWVRTCPRQGRKRKIKAHGSAVDLDKRVAVEELMNDRLGWTGLGHCDGGDIGSGTMNIFCYVADAKIAESVIVRELRARGFLEGAVIAERNEDAAEVLWPRDFEGAFSFI